MTKRDSTNFVKLCAQYNEEILKVKCTVIGIQNAVNTSLSGIEGLDLALNLYDFNNHRQLKMVGQMQGEPRMDFGIKLNWFEGVRNYWDTLC